MNAPRGEETIFAEALCLPPDQRAAYLAEATKDNPELRWRVEALLGSYGAGDFLEEAVTEKSGDTTGRYKLLQQIGEGGRSG